MASIIRLDKGTETGDMATIHHDDGMDPRKNS